ncbi:hypothetical protein H0O03_04660 [Candidatus Micrarchaeota archaeon]|nr:hypothetical protein [Candidatus Micrarchaeota archaeon]
MPFSQRFKYHPYDLPSYFQALKKVARHPFLSRDAKILVPLRGAVVPAAFVYSHRPDFTKSNFSFIPASGFIFESGQTIRRYLRNYLDEAVAKAKSPLNIVIVDEAKSGRVMYGLHQKFKEVQEDLARRDAEQKCSDFLENRDFTCFEEITREAEKKIDSEQRREEVALKQVLNKKDVALVKENGDYTIEGIALLKALKKYAGFDAENLFSHRLLVEQKLAASLNPRFKGELRLTGEEGAAAAERTKARISEPLKTADDLKKVFPLLAPYFAKDLDEVANNEFVKRADHLLPNTQTHEHIMANKELYDASFATLTNYRLNSLLEALRGLHGRVKLDSKALQNSIGTLIQRSRQQNDERKREVGQKIARLKEEWVMELGLKKPDAGRIAQLRDEMKELAKAHSKYVTQVQFRMIGLHGIDNFVTTLGYARLKDEGIVSQVDTNKIVTMDNPSTPVTYEQEDGKYSYKPLYVPSSREFLELSTQAGKHVDGTRFASFFGDLQKRMRDDLRYVKEVQLSLFRKQL